MDIKITKETYRLALTIMGIQSQTDNTIDICCDFIRIINRVRKKPSEENTDLLREKIAEMEIMIEQMRMVFDKDGAIDMIKLQKIQALQEKLSRTT